MVAPSLEGMVRTAGRVIFGFLIVAVFAASVGLLYRAWRQHENAVAEEIKTPNGIDEASFVTIGGAPQWISIRGDDRNNPALLFLSGGPGNSVGPFAYAFLPPWEKTFTVVDWDQRGSGFTFIRNGRDREQGLSIPQMTADAIQVAEYARARLHKKKLVLFAWSWGTILGLEAIHKRPDLFAVYVGTGQFVDGRANEAVGYASLLQRARAAHDDATVAQLRAVGPPPYATLEKQLKERSLLQPYTPAREREVTGDILNLVLFAPGYGLRDLYDIVVAAPRFSVSKLRGAIDAYDARRLGTRFDVPMVIADGADDIQVPVSIARAWFSSLECPHEEFIAIKNAAHLAPVSEPEAFLKVLNTDVRPRAIAAGG
jgi:pimeloyl-ACP methyl ester carboxylesterase